MRAHLSHFALSATKVPVLLPSEGLAAAVAARLRWGSGLWVWGVGVVRRVVWGLGLAPEDALQQLESQRQFARVNAVCQ